MSNTRELGAADLLTRDEIRAFTRASDAGGGVAIAAVGGGIRIVGGGPALRIPAGPFVGTGSRDAGPPGVEPMSDEDRRIPRTAKPRMPTKRAIAP